MGTSSLVMLHHPHQWCMPGTLPSPATPPPHRCMGFTWPYRSTDTNARWGTVWRTTTVACSMQPQSPTLSSVVTPAPNTGLQQGPAQCLPPQALGVKQACAGCGTSQAPHSTRGVVVCRPTGCSCTATAAPCWTVAAHATLCSPRHPQPATSCCATPCPTSAVSGGSEPLHEP